MLYTVIILNVRLLVVLQKQKRALYYLPPLEASVCLEETLHIFLLTGPVVLGLDEYVSLSGRFQPASSLASSALEVEVSEVNELEGLGNILLVVGFLLGLLVGTDGVVLRSGQTIGNVSIGSNGSGLDL